MCLSLYLYILTGSWRSISILHVGGLPQGLAGRKECRSADIKKCTGFFFFYLASPGLQWDQYKPACEALKSCGSSIFF